MHAPACLDGLPTARKIMFPIRPFLYVALMRKFVSGSTKAEHFVPLYCLYISYSNRLSSVECKICCSSASLRLECRPVSPSFRNGRAEEGIWLEVDGRRKLRRNSSCCKSLSQFYYCRLCNRCAPLVAYGIGNIFMLMPLLQSAQNFSQPSSICSVVRTFWQVYPDIWRFFVEV